MRVYEFARNYDMSSKELVTICQELGIDVKAQSKLDETQLATLSRHICRGKDTSEALEETTPKVVKKKKAVKHIAYVVTECEPFTSLGALGEAAAAFVEESVNNGRRLTVALPKYNMITTAYGSEMEWLMDLPIKLGLEEVRASLFKLLKDSVTYLFIGNDHYFARDEIYGYEDDAKRFAFFNRAVLEALPHLGVKISDIYVNDWHTSMIPLILNVDYKYHSFYQKVKTTLTIHNLEYQGWYSADILPDVLGISRQYYDNGLTRMGDAVNLLKSGIETASRIKLNDLSEEQLKLPQMQESGIVSVIEGKLNYKAS